jgi:hypothetical protein
MQFDRDNLIYPNYTIHIDKPDIILQNDIQHIASNQLSVFLNKWIVDTDVQKVLILKHILFKRYLVKVVDIIMTYVVRKLKLHGYYT